ncbi:ComEA family DNA-binding protein [Candidatus Roizmanbacteria bacterium]|nr:ComEA family DNA-binding protein [Candidatus Roizmanbacteria bacterium]
MRLISQTDLKKLKKYRVETFLLLTGFIITSISLLIYFNTFQQENEEIESFPTQSYQDYSKEAKIYIDVSGSVNKPDLYEASTNTRLKEIIKKAGGLSDDADKSFFSRNFNLARIVVDQEKIYIPSMWDVTNGYFIENQQTLNYISPNSDDLNNTKTKNIINVNSSSLEELDTLPGIGKITAQKIIEQRPFKALEELIDKKIVSKTVFEKIKNLVKI